MASERGEQSHPCKYTQGVYSITFCFNVQGKGIRFLNQCFSMPWEAATEHEQRREAKRKDSFSKHLLWFLQAFLLVLESLEMLFTDLFSCETDQMRKADFCVNTAWRVSEGEPEIRGSGDEGCEMLCPF